MTEAATSPALVSLEKAMLAEVCLGIPLGMLFLDLPRETCTDSDIAEPDTLIFRGEQLRLLKHLYRLGHERVGEAIGALVEQAEGGLHAGPWSVVDKPSRIAEAAPNDYCSLAKYWWPNPGSGDGLPYIRRDGEVNPECYAEMSDYTRLVRFSETVTLLALAAWFTGRSDFAERAVFLLETWFVNESTRQTEHFRLAQCIRGKSTANWAGIIEARHLVPVTEAIILLETIGVLRGDSRAAIKTWFGRLLGWLRHSGAGRKAAHAENNIGIWCDAQCIAYAHLCGRGELVDGIMRNSVIPKLKTQIAQDGSLPAEMLRARPFDYVAFALVAMAMVARAGEKSGIGLWDIGEGDGRNFQMAHNWLLRVSQAPDLVARLCGEASSLDESLHIGGVPVTALALHVRLMERMAEERERTLTLAREEAAFEHRRQRDEIRRLTAENERLTKRQSASPRATFIPSRGTMRRIVQELVKGTRGVPGCVSGVLGKVKERRENLVHLRALKSSRPGNEAALLEEYKQKGLDGEADSFVIYRIVGNDLYPRHQIGQTRKNVAFILENEPFLEACEKRWIVNRIIDPAEEQALLELLERYRQCYLRIPFNPEEYREIGLDEGCLPEPGFLSSQAFKTLSEKDQKFFSLAVYRLKNNYVMNNNGARNVALRDGRSRAKWVIPADGNCFLTTSAWLALREAVSARPHLKYFAVPMARIKDNRMLLKRSYSPDPFEEPQLVFRRDAVAEFDERFCYGRRPKVELFWRIGIPGKWDAWKDHPSDQSRGPSHPESGAFGVAGWIARLDSGMGELERQEHQSFLERGIARQDAILGTLEFVDELVREQSDEHPALLHYAAGGLERMRENLAKPTDAGLEGFTETLIWEADAALRQGPYSVVDKTSDSPSGDPHDYWHPAPYWWPNPATRDGLPYVWRDGERRPGTRMYEPESDRYDRTRLQRMFDDSTVLALAWAVTREMKYAEHAAKLIRVWFLDPSTRMNPHLNYAQVRMGYNGNRGNHTGIIEFKDLYYFLDAAGLAERSGALAGPDLRAFKCWLRKYLHWVLTSSQGAEECESKNNHGTYYDLQVAAIASYLGNGSLLDMVLVRALARLPEQFDSEGKQPLELKRNDAAHYCCYNLQGWVHLAEIGSSRGVDFWQAGSGMSLLSRGLLWLIGYAGRTWPFSQAGHFDRARFEPLIAAAIRAGLVKAGDTLFEDGFLASNPRFFAHDGISPYWNSRMI